jgi:hypothetical protein
VPEKEMLGRVSKMNRKEEFSPSGERKIATFGLKEKRKKGGRPMSDGDSVGSVHLSRYGVIRMPDCRRHSSEKEKIEKRSSGS